MGWDHRSSSLVNYHLKVRFLNLLETIMVDGPTTVPCISRFHLIKDQIFGDNDDSLSSISCELTDLIDALSDCRVFAYKRDAALRRGFLFFFLSPSKVWFMGKMNRRLGKIQKKLNKAVKEKSSSQVILTVTDAAVELDRETRPAQDGSKIIGFDEVATNIDNFLMNKSKDDGFAAIAIVGTGGAGKTTLAQKVFDSIKGAFDTSIWVCLWKTSEPSNNYLSEEMVKAMLKEVESNGEELESAEVGVIALLEKLRQRLKGRKYLIVLDDVWSVDDSYEDLSYDVEELGGKVLEDKLSHALPKGSGGVVIVTSRLENTAKKMVGSYNVIRLDSLPKQVCWSIFESTIPQDELQNLYKFKNDIIHNCHGLPLAAKALADIFPLIKASRELQ